MSSEPIDRLLFDLVDLPSALRRLPRPDHQPVSHDTVRSASRDVAVGDAWVRAVASSLGFEASFVSLLAGELEGLAALEAYAVICTPNAPHQALLVRGAQTHFEVWSLADGSRARVPVQRLKRWALTAMSADFARDLEVVTGGLTNPVARARVAAHMSESILGAEPVAQAWVLQPAPTASFWGQLRSAKVGAGLVRAAVAYGAQYAAFLGAWALVGKATLDGRIGRGYFIGALLLFATAVGLRAFSSQFSFDALQRVGTRLKRWLLRGALNIGLEVVRRRGTGELLGLVLEASAVERLALDGVLLGLFAVLELGVAGAALASRPVGRGAALWVAVVLVAGLVAIRALMIAQRSWTTARTKLTDVFVDSIVGHRTRLAQCAPSRWHTLEEDELERYRSASERLDRETLWVRSLLGRAGGVGSFVALAFASRAVSADEFAIAVGAILLANSSLLRLFDALSRLTQAKVSFDATRPLFDAATPADPPPQAPRHWPPVGELPLLEARRIHFRYPGAAGEVLTGASLAVREGERVLVEAPSGAGKSTLLSLLSGVRTPTSGLLAARGVDRLLISDADWHDRVSAVPQFNENHMLSGTVAFNCLMGVQWPATSEEVAQAEALLKELALGPVLNAMPARMEQAVGETGWRLSHGEQSRIFVARVLLRKPDVVLLDESFGALDPDTFLLCLRVIERHARSVILVAHR